MLNPTKSSLFKTFLELFWWYLHSQFKSSPWKSISWLYRHILCSKYIMWHKCQALLWFWNEEKWSILVQTKQKQHPSLKIISTHTHYNGRYRKIEDNKYWPGGGKTGTLMHCLWKCKTVKPLWKTVWWVLKKIKHTIPIWPSNPTSRYIFKKNKQTNKWKQGLKQIFVYQSS